jgi:hypothetical protein
MTDQHVTWLASATAQKPGHPGIAKTSICREAARLCRELYGDQMRALVLTGSLARDEATVVEDRASRRLLGDAEFLLILHERSTLPLATEERLLEQAIEAALESLGIGCRISLSAAHPGYLRDLSPHIFAYELKACGQVVQGDLGILSLIRSFSPSEIPLEDGWRLLANRVIEQFESIGVATNGPESLHEHHCYRTLKLYLDMATSFLLFAGGYAPTYRERLEKLQAMADRPAPESGWPFPLAGFADDVAECTRWKLGADVPRLDMESEIVQRALGYARKLWSWELTRLTDGSRRLPDLFLMESWMRRQSLPDRLRGWLYVLRRRGWYRDVRAWPRWARLAWRGSPRYWLYAAAGELLVRLPERCGAEENMPSTDPALMQLLDYLPVPDETAQSEQNASRRLISAIAWNYHEFLEATRA